MANPSKPRASATLSAPPLRIVLVRLRPAEVDQQGIAKVLGSVTIEAMNHFCTGLLVGPKDFSVVFRVKLS
jgi:hypothetical protein